MHTDNTMYNTRPNYPLVNGKLSYGYEVLAQCLLADNKSTWLIDGMSSVPWNALCDGLRYALEGHRVVFLDVASARLAPEMIQHLLADSLDNGDAVFGKLYPGQLSDFFAADELQT